MQRRAANDREAAADEEVLHRRAARDGQVSGQRQRGRGHTCCNCQAAADVHLLQRRAANDREAAADEEVLCDRGVCNR